MINGALHLGYSLARWTNSEVIMLPKDTDTIQINRLRVINKYEADFNLVLKYFRPHTATRKVDKEGLLGDNQWGTKPLWSAEQPVLIDELITDIHRVTCHNLAKLENDATSCYDRMICNLITLCSRSFHVPDKVYQLQTNALHDMKYKVLTSLGTSCNS